jgi:predicted ribosome quality control (RQC) complex YloA/Tae2 family protein
VMNNYYTLIYLIQEWKRTLPGIYFTEAWSSRKDTLNLYFEHPASSPHSAVSESHESGLMLTFCSAAARTALFIDRYRRPKTSNAASFFDLLVGQKLQKIYMATDDRYITFEFDSHQLIFLLYTNSANVLLVSDSTIRESFKKNLELEGNPVSAPNPAKAFPKLHNDPIRSILSVDPLLPRSELRYICSKTDYEGKDLQEIQVLANRISISIAACAHPHFCEEYGFSVLDPSVSGGQQIKAFSSVNELISSSFYQTTRNTEFTSRKTAFQKRLVKAEQKLSVALAELDNLDKALEKAEFFENIGHLLMASPPTDTSDGVVKLPDVFSDGAPEITVKVNPDLDLVQNAALFYDKAKASRQSYLSAGPRREQVSRKLNTIQQLQQNLLGIEHLREFDKWLRSADGILQDSGLGRVSRDAPVNSWRVATEQGYSIKIGKHAAGNEDLLRISHKEDIWLHARGYPGSHVTIEMKRQAGFPPESVLEKAARYAAFFSKGRGSSLVPVIFTKRKFVIKSKGAAPGAVKVIKENVRLVQPEDPSKSTTIQEL